MALWRPDTTFYPSARMVMQAARENLGDVVTFNPEARRQQPDAFCVMDLNPGSQSYGTVVETESEDPGSN
jgi:methanethiol oxidase